MSSQQSPSNGRAYHPVVVRPEPPGRFTAQALGVPEIHAEADTADEAVEQVRRALARWAGSLRWVALDPAPPSPHPALEFAGHAKDDPDFAAYLEEIQRFRQEADARECCDTSSTPTT